MSACENTYCVECANGKIHLDFLNTIDLYTPLNTLNIDLQNQCVLNVCSHTNRD